ncbi:MAG TPA: hypothetical protein VF787_03315 [Thermoanaerobaculia bacterium]
MPEKGGNFTLSAGRVHHVPDRVQHAEELRRGIKRLVDEMAGKRTELAAKRRALRYLERHAVTARGA